MRAHRDAFGQELYDYFKHGRGYEIVERDDGFVVPTKGPERYFAEYRDWPVQDKKAMRYARGRVLDVGCGAGRHSLYLQRKRHNVLGLDSSRLAAKVCRLRGIKHVKRALITQYCAPDRRFDTVLLMGGNVGLLRDVGKARKLLRRFHRMTTAKARILAQSVDPYNTAMPEHLAYHRLNRRRGRLPGQLRIRVRYSVHATPWFDWLIISTEEMKRILQQTGWTIQALIEPGGAEYTAVLVKDDR